jgi:PleD family two-component response regulator
MASSFESKVFQELIDIADKRLYKAKKNGRNQVVFS